LKGVSSKRDKQNELNQNCIPFSHQGCTIKFRFFGLLNRPCTLLGEGKICLDEEKNYKPLYLDLIKKTFKVKPSSREVKPLTKQVAKDIATQFYYHWHNASGPNTEQGFEDWWDLHWHEFLKEDGEPTSEDEKLANPDPINSDMI